MDKKKMALEFHKSNEARLNRGFTVMEESTPTGGSKDAWMPGDISLISSSPTIQLSFNVKFFFLTVHTMVS